MQGRLELTFRPLTQSDASTIAEWRYADPYSLYDPDDETVANMLDPANRYYAALGADDELIGYCCFGVEARVPGLEELSGTLDVGGGLRPDLTGIGLGAGFLRASCELGSDLFAPNAFRVAIAAFNRRAQRVAAALGFEPVGIVPTPDRDFVLLTRPA